VLPYEGIHDSKTVASHIKSGERPPRPRNQDANWWLRDEVWDMVVTCWSQDRKKRWEVRAVRKLFLALALREVQNANSGN